MTARHEPAPTVAPTVAPAHAPAPSPAPEPALVTVRELCKTFDVSAPWLTRLLTRRAPQHVRAVDGVSFSIARGQTLGLVGESGCGKSTVARLLVGLLQPTAGQMQLDGIDLQQAYAAGPSRALRRRLQMIFQDPYASLNPRWRVADIVAEPLLEHGLLPERSARRERVAELLAAVGLAPGDAAKLPHQFSGGQRQRISIARALASNPEFLVCDEPTSALDVSVQAQVLNLMRTLQQQHGLTYLFISHNLAVVRHMADQVGVMFLGRIVELADRATLFARPLHPYTRMLLAAVPDVTLRHHEPPTTLGEPPNPLQPPTDCSFHPRCPHANERCRSERPALRNMAGTQVACHAVEEGRLV